jgi:hypothetical protein
VAALALAGMVYWAMWPRVQEPVSKGKPLTYWVNRLPGLPSGPLPNGVVTIIVPAPKSGAENPYEAIRQIGTNALPYLFATLQRQDSKRTLRIQSLASKLHLNRFWFRSEAESRWQAEIALLILKPLPREWETRLRSVEASTNKTAALAASLVRYGELHFSTNSSAVGYIVD